MNKKIKLTIVSLVILFVASLTINYFVNYGKLTIETIPTAVSVRINNKTYDSANKIKLRPGKYDIELSKNGYVTYHFSDIKIKSLKTTEIKRTLATPNEEKLQNTLPYDDGLTFNIVARDNGDKYIYDIGLYAILNGDGQVATYNQQLEELRPEALSYIKRFGVNPDQITINWLQEKAKK